MQKIFEKIIEKLEERIESNKKYLPTPLFRDTNNQIIGLKKAIEIVKQAAAEHEECYKDCGECEAYDKEKHHCPKFCKVITEAVKEIEENHNGWIPCSERLPSDCEIHEVTAQFSNGKVYTEFAYYDETKEEWWKHDNDGLVNVISWKEPSEPYQPKGE